MIIDACTQINMRAHTLTHWRAHTHAQTDEHMDKRTQHECLLTGTYTHVHSNARTYTHINTHTSKYTRAHKSPFTYTKTKISAYEMRTCACTKSARPHIQSLITCTNLACAHAQQQNLKDLQRDFESRLANAEVDFNIKVQLTP